MARIGFIGLGTMGAPMAHNLLAAGHELYFFARRAEVINEFREAGATACSTCAEVAQSSDVVFTIVTADEQVEQVVLGPNGVIAGGDAGTLLIEMSTISPNTACNIASQLATASMSMLDAPVSGGPSGARKGTLTILIGGDAADVERAHGLLQTLGMSIIHVGPVGAGQTTKLVNQLLAGGVMALIGEAMAIAKAAGLDLSRTADAISASSGNSKIFEARHRFVIEDRYDPGFKSTLMRKDVALAIDLAGQLGIATPVASAALRQYDAAIQGGNAERDFSVVAKHNRSFTNS